MKLGVMTVLLGNMKVEEAFKYLSESDVQAVELGAGGYPGKAHANPEELLKDDRKIQELKDLAEKYNLEISSLSCHEILFILKESQMHFMTILKDRTTGRKTGSQEVNTFSDVGDSPPMYLNWVICPGRMILKTLTSIYMLSNERLSPLQRIMG